MKEGQVHQIDDFAARELQRSLTDITRTGSAIYGVTMAITEIGVARGNEEELSFLNTYVEGCLWYALESLGKSLNDKAYKIADRFGLEEPC